jgi:hypothetical protein
VKKNIDCDMNVTLSPSNSCSLFQSRYLHGFLQVKVCFDRRVKRDMGSSDNKAAPWYCGGLIIYKAQRWSLWPQSFGSSVLLQDLSGQQQHRWGPQTDSHTMAKACETWWSLDLQPRLSPKDQPFLSGLVPKYIRDSNISCPSHLELWGCLGGRLCEYLCVCACQLGFLNVICARIHKLLFKGLQVKGVCYSGYISETMVVKKKWNYMLS